MHPASHLGPRDDDRASDVVPTTRCSWWTTPRRMDLTSGSPSECHLANTTSVEFQASPVLCITVIYSILLHLMFVGLYRALKCRSCLKTLLHELRIPFEMDTSMLRRVAAMLNQDLGRSRVIFLALTRGQELVVSILITE
jgi:hypothetical protein